MVAKLRVAMIANGIEVRSPSRRLFLTAALFALIAAWTAPASVAAACVFVLVALGSFGLALYITLRPTRIVFEGDRFTCAKLEHLISDIASFATEGGGGRTTRVVLVTKAGARVPLPVAFDDVTITYHGSEPTIYGAAAVAQAEQVARRLEEVLEDVRQGASQFRVAAGGPRLAEPARMETKEDDDASERAVKSRDAS